MKNIAILGSTGSIGTQTLDIVDQNKEDLQVVALAAGSNITLLEKQARKYRPTLVAVWDQACAKELKENIESNPVKKAQVEEFEHLRYKIQVETMQGSGNATEAKQMLQEKYAELLKDEEIKKYFDAEIQFNVMIADVNKIIAEAVKDVL